MTVYFIVAEANKKKVNCQVSTGRVDSIEKYNKLAAECKEKIAKDLGCQEDEIFIVSVSRL